MRKRRKKPQGYVSRGREVDVLRNLLNACRGFVLQGFESMPEHLATSFALCQQYVFVNMFPARARLIFEAPTSEVCCGYELTGKHFPLALGEATSAFVNVAVPQLQPEVVDRLVRTKGAGLGVLIRQEDQTAHLMLDIGTTEPVQLFKMGAVPRATVTH